MEELQQEWSWSERYAPQPEILSYLEQVADRFDLRRDIQLSTRVVSAHFDEESAGWQVETDRGDRARARFVVMATGCLSSQNVPAFDGLEDFEGACFHTGRWPHEEVDFTGQRVAVIGTGSSAIQSIPIIAEQAAALFVFQRTPNFSVPAHNAPLDPSYEKSVKAEYPAFRARNAQNMAGLDSRPSDRSALEVSPEERRSVYEERWRAGGLPFMAAFNDLALSQEANDSAAEFLRGKIREIVEDEEVAALLSPHTVVGCKRLCVDTGYYATFNREHVTLVDVSRTPIERFTARGIRVGDREVEVDAIVLATGFDAMTGALLGMASAGARGRRSVRGGPRGPRPIWASGSRASPTSSRSPGPAAPRCSPTGSPPSSST